MDEISITKLKIVVDVNEEKTRVTIGQRKLNEVHKNAFVHTKGLPISEPLKVYEQKLVNIFKTELKKIYGISSDADKENQAKLNKAFDQNWK